MPKAAQDESLSPAQIYTMAVACAFAIATLYYNQPLLPLIKATFGTSDYQASLIVTLGQIGYALGLFLFVPIGDRIDRRRLILSLLLANTVCEAACAMAPDFRSFLGATFIAGLTTVTPQIIIPTVAGIAAPSRRGRVVGVLLSGMSAGLLFGRTFSGFVGEMAGWRSVFVLAMFFNLLLIVAIWFLLPRPAATTDMSYPRLLRSLWRLFVEQPVLRAACATGFLAFGAFSALWATLASLLFRPPYHFGANIAGAFGLVGIVGIFSTPVVGRLVDRLGTGFVVGAGAATVAVAFVFVSRGESALWPVVVGIALIDIGYRAVLVANQTRIYPLQAGAHSRLNTLFMTSVFLGGAVGSVCGAAAAAYWSWTGLAAAGGGLGALGVVVHLVAPTTKPSSS
jgi:predicted MFS family arabinose efflux permease